MGTSASSDQSTAWWVASVAAVAPAAGLLGASGLAGVTSGSGTALALGGVLWLALELFVLQPRLDRRFLGGGSLAMLARRFLQRALLQRSVADVGLELESTVRHALGTERTLLVVPDPAGGVRVLGADQGQTLDLGEAEAAFQWLGERGEPATLEELRPLAEFEGAAATARLVERLGGEVAIPLRHRLMLLGLLVIGRPGRRVEPSALWRFHRALGAHATVAVANTYLGEHAQGKGGLSRELGLATALQEAILPEERVVRAGQVAVRGLCRPMAECGGDMWSFLDLGDGRVLLLIADATGHGAAPAMLTAVARGVLDAARTVKTGDPDPAWLLATLNREIHAAGKDRYHMTAFVAVLDPAGGQMHFANAGHNFPYLVSRVGDAAKVEVLVARGNTLGSAAVTSYQAHTRPLSPGDRLVLYTDGITEAGSPRIEPYGEKRFRAALVTTAAFPVDETPDALVAEMHAYLAGHPVQDDVTLVVAHIETAAAS